ncbi:hypothetical protein A6E13_15695 [Aliivibrio fischeri]|uniref:hypothetical protein n=1 Tax=Aliivibrio fischeri TaxID=668 RepID=UPI00080E5D4E|nr:hypothetical protein [Aliivibrio fischeri]OCH32015.1 hypothetical protein A6E13_15695 [Aliivibrio fischeri]
MQYKQEFGSDFQLGFELSQHPYLIDKSYRNDDCPSFYFVHNNQFYILWVDYSESTQRENENSLRYTIQCADNEGDVMSPEVYANGGDIVFESEELEFTYFYEAV